MKWVRNFYQSFTGIPDSFLDGLIAVGIAFLTAISLGLAQEDSYKYVDPTVRFWSVLVVGAIVQGAHALSKYRDGSFQRNRDVADRKAMLEGGSGLVKTEIASTTSVSKDAPP